MIHSTMRVNLLDLIKCISEALRLLSPDMAEHHNQAAYISYKLCEALQWRENETIKTTLAASLHDIGAISLEEKMEDLRFEDSSIYNHAQLGYLLLDKFTPFQELAPLVRYHHQPWVAEKDGKENLAPQGSYLIHLADRVAVSIDNQKHILQQRDDICTHISSQKHVYNPEHVEAFLQIAQKESFWLDIVSPSLNEVLSRLFNWKTVVMDSEQLLEYTRFLSRLVDFRSPLNARHSSGVAASAAALARLCGFSEHECLMMRMAGYLHDIGKLAVSAAILEKNGPLDTNEISIIKSHPYYTYNILAIVEDFNTINLWASLHHERLDGRGYPFRIRAGNMPLGSQIVGLADVYTALNEERPYRTAMSRRDSMKVMAKMVNDGAINGDLLKILDANFDEINEQRINIQTESAEEYRMLNPIFAARYAKK